MDSAVVCVDGERGAAAVELTMNVVAAVGGDAVDRQREAALDPAVTSVEIQFCRKAAWHLQSYRAIAGLYGGGS